MKVNIGLSAMWVNWTVRCEALLDTGDDFHGVGVQLAPNNLRRDVVEARDKSPCAVRLRQTYPFPLQTGQSTCGQAGSVPRRRAH